MSNSTNFSKKDRLISESSLCFIDSDLGISKSNIDFMAKNSKKTFYQSEKFNSNGKIAKLSSHKSLDNTKNISGNENSNIISQVANRVPKSTNSLSKHCKSDSFTGSTQSEDSFQKLTYNNFDTPSFTEALNQYDFITEICQRNNCNRSFESNGDQSRSLSRNSALDRAFDDNLSFNSLDESDELSTNSNSKNSIFRNDKKIKVTVAKDAKNDYSRHINARDEKRLERERTINSMKNRLLKEFGSN